MKKDLIPQNGSFFKANLHCHSTISDGHLSPAELKAAYKAHGYHVLAITDHDRLVDHSELCDPSFLLLNGYEYAAMEKKEGRFARTCHLCLYARDPRNTLPVSFDPDRPGLPLRLPAKYAGPFSEREYSPDCINAVIRDANEHGFIVAYNHPTWSLESYAEYCRYEGMFSMEIYNGICSELGAFEYNPRVYDDLLRQGKRIYCSATDDNHDSYPLGDPLNDSFRGFVMIKAKALTYDAVFGALERGDFYASCGPEITSLSMSDGVVHLECAPAREITMTTQYRKWGHVCAPDGESVTEADFSVSPEDGYVRFDVVGHDGLRANTRAYFTDELFKAE